MRRSAKRTIEQRRTGHAQYVRRVLERGLLGNRPRIEAVEDVSPVYSGTPAARSIGDAPQRDRAATAT